MNSPDIVPKFQYTQAEKETKKEWNSWTLIICITITVVAGAISGGVGAAATGSFLWGAVIGVGTGAICAAVDHAVTGDDFKRCLLVYCIVGAVAGIAGAAIGTVISSGSAAGAAAVSESASAGSGMYASSSVSSIHTEEVEYILENEPLRQAILELIS